MSVTKEISIKELNALKSSIDGRLSRLRKCKPRFDDDWDSSPTPIEAIGVFSEEIDVIEKTLRKMQDRVNNAEITIEL